MLDCPGGFEDTTMGYIKCFVTFTLHSHINSCRLMVMIWCQLLLCRLKAVSASQGLMLEGISPALTAEGGAHYGCADKDPHVRLAVIEAAGRARVPFTTGG